MWEAYRNYIGYSLCINLISQRKKVLSLLYFYHIFFRQANFVIIKIQITYKEWRNLFKYCTYLTTNHRKSGKNKYDDYNWRQNVTMRESRTMQMKSS